MSFASLGLSEAVVGAVQAAGYAQPTPVQLRAIPAVLQGRDLMVAAQTGTGKTAGFALPVLERLFPTGHPAPAPHMGARQVRVLVLTPTRELAAQVHDSFKLYARDLPLRSACIFGGVGQKPQVDAIAKGLDLLVACPGRLLDLIGQKAVDLSRIEILVLDEADRMLDMGFIHDVKKVLSHLPAQRQNLLFSATFSADIIALANKLLHDPERIEVTPPNSTVERIEQRVFRIAAPLKRALLAHLITQGAWEQVLVFTRTKHGANRLAEYLDKHGLPAAAIHGNKSQNARTRALADFKDNSLRVLVATDIAARGLDIDQLPHVVNFELPNVEEDYVHRIGRTGRAGRAGEAVSLVAPDEERLLKSIERLTRQQIPDGDSLGFDPDSLPPPVAEPPREPREPRAPRSPRHKAQHAKPRGEATNANAEPATDRETIDPTQAGDSAHKKRRRRRGGKAQNGTQGPVQAQPQPQAQPANRDPEEFLDDDFDNFGNRADYVSPAQNAGKNRRRAQGQAKGSGQNNGSQRARPQGQSQGARQSQGGSAQNGARKGGPRKGSAAGKARSTNEPRFDGFYDERSASPLATPRTSGKQPLIIRKGERLPTLEQLNELDNRQTRRERPALLASRSNDS